MKEKLNNYSIDESIDKKHLAPGTQIHFEADLIVQLEKEHVRILKSLQKIYVAFELKNSKYTIKKLKKFKIKFTDYLILEIPKLYIYLEHSFSKNSKKQNQVKEIRRDIRKISKEVLDFVDKYRVKLENKKKTKKLRRDFVNIYLTLKKRFKREEKKLFPLYKDIF